MTGRPPKLLNLAAVMFFPSSTQTRLTPGQKPQSRKERARCNHMTLSRLFNSANVEPLALHCSSCNRPPGLGYLFRCTEDHDGLLPPSDFISDSDGLFLDERKDDNRMNELSPSTMKAISANHYTPEEVKVLVKQKTEVRTAILNHMCTRFETNASTSSSSNSTDSSSSSSELDTTLDTVSSGTAAAIFRLPPDWDNRKQGEFATSFPPDPTVAGILPRDPRAPREGYRPDFPCSARLCQTCRQWIREKSYQCLDAVVEEPYEEPSRWDLASRPVSDARIVAQLGLPKPLRKKQGSINSWQGLIDAYSNASTSLLKPEHKTDSSEKAVNESRSTFRKTLRKKLSQVFGNSESPSKLDDVVTISSSTAYDFMQSPAMPRLPMRTLANPFAEDEFGRRIIYTTPYEDLLMFMIAVNTALPNAAADTEDIGGEVEVEDGVAVTEEGVTFGVADIMTKI